MSDLPTLCDEVLACTQTMLKDIERDDLQISQIAEQIQRRSALFSSIQSIATAQDAQLLTQLGGKLQPLDAKILAWMRTRQQELAGTLQKVKKGHARSAHASAEPRILIQSA